MNKLELVQRLAREVGASGTITTTIGLVGEHARLNDWIGQAWLELQNTNPDWTWLRTSMAFNTVTGQPTYDPELVIGPSVLANWVPNTFRVYETTVANETFLQQLDYDVFRNSYMLGTTRSTQGYPSIVTIQPDKTIRISLVPNSGDYVILADYISYPLELLVDADVPAMPTRFHMALVYKAMEWYAAYENAPEVAMRGGASYRKMMDDLRQDQLPKITRGYGYL